MEIYEEVKQRKVVAYECDMCKLIIVPESHVHTFLFWEDKGFEEDTYIGLCLNCTRKIYDFIETNGGKFRKYD